MDMAIFFQLNGTLLAYLACINYDRKKFMATQTLGT